MNNSYNMQMMQQLQQQYQALSNNPMQFFKQMNIDIPQNITNNPDAILQYLLSSGRFTQQQVNSAYQAFYNMKNR